MANHDWVTIKSDDVEVISKIATEYQSWMILLNLHPMR